MPPIDWKQIMGIKSPSFRTEEPTDLQRSVVGCNSLDRFRHPVNSPNSVHLQSNSGRQHGQQPHLLARTKSSDPSSHQNAALAMSGGSMLGAGGGGSRSNKNRNHHSYKRKPVKDTSLLVTQ